jgi:hypothetical protein
MSGYLEKIQPWDPSVIQEFDSSIKRLTRRQGGGLTKSRTLLETGGQGSINVVSWREPFSEYYARLVAPVEGQSRQLDRRHITVFQLPVDEIVEQAPNSDVVTTSTTYVELVHDNAPAAAEIIYRRPRKIDLARRTMTVALTTESGPSLSDVLEEENPTATQDVIRVLQERNMLPWPGELELAMEILREHTNN